MTDEELIILLTDLESDLVERKSSIAEKGKIAEAICAFANDLPNHRKPGVVFVGAADDGAPPGLPVTDELLRELSDLRTNGNIHPFPSLTVEKRRLRDADIAVLVVHPSDGPPVRYRGRAWIRVGPRRSIASPEDERRLAEKRRSRELPYDAQPVSIATLDDLDLEFFRREYLPQALPRDVLAQNQRTMEQQLASLRFASVDARPTVVGLLVLGIEPTGWIGGAYVQFLRIDGTDLAAPIGDAKDVRGPVPQLLRQLEEVLAAHITTASDVRSSPIERRYPTYPLAALVQLIRNAVMHRNYEGTNAPVRVTWFNDRIEILSPGGPFGQVTVENFGQPGVVDYRNPNLAEAMRSLGLVQRFGVGIPIARDELARNTNPPPEFVVNETNVLVKVRPRR
jgi:ATP-dependent DNA helicase RecG